MPHKTIYVGALALPLFDQAQELAGGNLSAAIAQALQQYVTQDHEPESGEILVRVGSGGAYVQQRFQGQLIGKQIMVSEDHAAMITYRAYLTAKQNFAIYQTVKPNDSLGGLTVDSAHLEVYPSLDAVRSHIPEPLLAVIMQYQRHGAIEDLDI